LDGFFATCAIDAKEKRNVVTYDVSGEFLQPEMPKKDGKVLLKLRDVLWILCVMLIQNIRRQLFMKKEKRPYIYWFLDQFMDALKLHYCGMNITARHSRKWVSKLILMIGVLPTK